MNKPVSTKPLRIAFIAPYPASAVLPPEVIKPKYRYGEHPATWVKTLSEGLTRLPNVTVAVFIHSRAVNRTHHAEVNGVNYTFIPKYEPIRSDPFHGYWPGAWALRQAIAQFNPDLVQGFGIETGCAGIAVRLPWPCVVFIQGIIEKTVEYRNIHPLKLAVYIRDESRTLFRSDAFIAETVFARHWVTGHNPRAVVRVIPHAVDPNFFANRPDFREPLMVCIGSLNRIKGPDVVVRAFAACTNPEARLVVAGDGFLREPLKQLARELGVADRITFAGHQSREEVRTLMERARLLVIGSRMDTSPNILSEAHAAGLPVVGTTAGGIPDMVEHGVDGLLSPIDDPDRMAANLDKLIGAPETCREMGRHGRAKVLSLNDPERIAIEHVEFYRDVLLKKNAATLQRRRLRPGIRQRLIIRKVASFIPYQARLGHHYRRWRDFLDNAQTWDREHILGWQFERIREMVRYAYENTEGYRELYRNVGATPDDIRTYEDFYRLPFVSKEMIRDNLQAFSNPNLRGMYGTTGGSTGIPFGFYYSSTTRQVENAFMHSCWSWVGWKPGTKCAILRGGFIGTPDHVSDYDPYQRELRLSSYYLTADTLPHYLDAIRAAGIRTLQAYPSSLNLLCDLMRNAGASLAGHLDLVLLGSENVYDWQLEKFRAVLPNTRLFAWYGQAEQVTLAPWCEKSTRYHSRPFYAHTEIADEAGRAVGLHQEGEIIGTNFHNRLTPFIRYRTMDRAVFGGVTCPDCGRQFMLMDKITGRAQEVIVTAQGRYISMTAINMHDEIFDGIRQFQLRQSKRGHVVFTYVPASALGSDKLARIYAGLSAKLGRDVQLELREVDSIPRTKSGKFRFLLQELPIQYGDREP